MQIKVNDNIKATDELINQKPWFNGIHKFSSVKIIPAEIVETKPDLVEKPPSVLKINVADKIGVSSGLI